MKRLLAYTVVISVEIKDPVMAEEFHANLLDMGCGVEPKVEPAVREALENATRHFTLNKQADTYLSIAKERIQRVPVP